MITALKTTTIYIGDVDQAIEFYTKSLGFDLRSDQPMGEDARWVEVAPPGGQAGIILAHGFGGWSPERVGTFTGIVFEAEDIQATYEDLSSRGVHFTEPPTAQPWGMMQALFEDADGNGYVLVSR